MSIKKRTKKKMRVARMFMIKKQHAIKFLANKKLVDLTFNRKSRKLNAFLTHFFSLTINYIA